MNSEVHPVVAGLVILATMVAIALWAWGSGVAASLGGPAELVTGPGGHHFVEIQNYLVEHDADGAYLKTHHLDALGVDVLLGGFAFFSNGDVLLRRGPDPRSFLDNIRAYKRETNRNSIVPDDQESGLFRCSLDTSACDRFGEEGIDFKAAYGVFIDWETDDVYISDTTRHLLRKYSSEGVELAPPADGFEFPNQLMLQDGQLLVVDTNNHVVRRLESQSSAFADLIDSESVVPDVAEKAQQTWPSHFARVVDEWWVNNMQTGMNQGGIYVFDLDWKFVQRVALPPNADPISILAVGDEVWVSDWNNDAVRRFTVSGEPLPNLKSKGLETILTLSRQERLVYTILSYAGVVLVVVMLLGLVVRAFALGTINDPNRQSAGKDSGEASADALPLHLEPDEKLRKRMTRALGIVAVLAACTVFPLVYIFRAFDNPDVAVKLVVPVVAMFAIIVVVAWANKSNWGTSVVLDGNTLTLRDYTGRQSSCPVRKVRFDDTAIATRDAIVILGRPKAQIYNREDVHERLIPRLDEAQRVGPLEMLKIQVGMKHPQGLVTVIAVIGIIACGIFVLATR